MSNHHEQFVLKYLTELSAMQVPASVRNRVDWNKLHPAVVPGFLLVGHRIIEAKRRGELSQLYIPFDGYRSPELQLDMVKRNVSKAGPWQSAHNYGLAVDFVGWNPEQKWNWQPADSDDWKMIGTIATNAGMLRPITWDKPHVEHPVWHSVKKHLIQS